MPYLTCPECHISVFRAPLDPRVACCPRCGSAVNVDLRFRRAADTPARAVKRALASTADAQLTGSAPVDAV